MGKQKSQDSVFGLGDYDQPTEPVRIVLPVQAPQPYTPIPPTVPIERNGRYFQDNGSYQQGAYPVLPPAPEQSAQQAQPGALGVSRKPRRSRLPGLIVLLCVLIQAILLARVVCMLLNISADSLWLNLLFSAGDLFTWPTRWLVAHINVSVLAGTQLLIYLEFLLTILGYGILSRLLARLFRAILNN